MKASKAACLPRELCDARRDLALPVDPAGLEIRRLVSLDIEPSRLLWRTPGVSETDRLFSRPRPDVWLACSPKRSRDRLIAPVGSLARLVERLRL